MDDTFIIWERGWKFWYVSLNELNKQILHIKFTKKVEEDNNLPFLGVLVSQTQSTVHTKVYRRVTDAVQNVNFNWKHEHVKTFDELLIRFVSVL